MCVCSFQQDNCSQKTTNHIDALFAECPQRVRGHRGRGEHRGLREGGLPDPTGRGEAGGGGDQVLAADRAAGD